MKINFPRINIVKRSIKPTIIRVSNASAKLNTLLPVIFIIFLQHPAVGMSDIKPDEKKMKSREWQFNWESLTVRS